MTDIATAVAPALPTPKYTIGDTVFAPHWKRVEVTVVCPDCQDTREWHVKTPGGTEFTVPCARCERFNSMPSVTRAKFEPRVEAHLIGSISVSTHRRWSGDSYGPSVEYMSHPGGGSVWSEDKVFATHDAAMEAARFLAHKAEEEELAKAGGHEKHRRTINGYQIAQALAADYLKQEREARWKYEAAIVRIQELELSYVQGLDEMQLRRVARHLLTELNEDVPREWGEE